MSRPTEDVIEQRVRRLVRDIPDYPKPGIVFKDITPLLASAVDFADATDAMAAPFAQHDITHVVAIESRGFIFGAPVAQRLGASFVPVRKPGKLPYTTRREEYALEYGTDALEIHADSFAGATRVLIVDDVLATGDRRHRGGDAPTGRVGGRCGHWVFVSDRAQFSAGHRATWSGVAARAGHLLARCHSERTFAVIPTEQPTACSYESS